MYQRGSDYSVIDSNGEIQGSRGPWWDLLNCSENGKEIVSADGWYLGRSVPHQILCSHAVAFPPKTRHSWIRWFGDGATSWVVARVRDTLYRINYNSGVIEKQINLGRLNIVSAVIVPHTRWAIVACTETNAIYSIDTECENEIRQIASISLPSRMTLYQPKIDFACLCLPKELELLIQEYAVRHHLFVYEKEHGHIYRMELLFV